MPTRPPIHNPAGQRTIKRVTLARYRQSSRRKEHQRLYDWAWRRYSKARLERYPWCVLCAEEGTPSLATCTDHKIPHEGNPALFNDPNNHQSLCKWHHDRKTALEDGGFGRKK